MRRLVQRLAWLADVEAVADGRIYGWTETSLKRSWSRAAGPSSRR